MAGSRPALGLAAALALLSVLALLPVGTPAPAQDAKLEACSAFGWPLQREQAWFAAPGLPRLDSGATLSADSPSAVLALKPIGDVPLPRPPSREPKPGTYAGLLHLPAPTMPGLFQITLSDDAWIDVAEDGAAWKKPVAHTGNRNCPGLRKSLRFQFGSKPLTVAISGAPDGAIKVAVAPAE